jgi:nucleoside-diphosphate-sugar epimerase
MSTLAITGASGFIGRALLAGSAADSFPEIRVLAHDRPVPHEAGRRVLSMRGDLRDPAASRALVVPGATVVNLAFVPGAAAASDNLTAICNLLCACRAARVRRFIHCSTAAVAGAAPEDVVDEQTPCRPRTAYEQIKYRIEQEVLDVAAGRFQAVILRPSAVFGPGGRNLVTLAARLLRRGELVNAAHAAVHGTRRMHLVSVHNVVAALGFLACPDRDAGHPAYIVSDDHDPLNNYRDVEAALRRYFNLGPGRRLPELGPALLSALLGLRGRSDVNPRRIYSDGRLAASGFVKPWTLDRALAEFASGFLAEAGLRPAGCRAHS